MATDCEETQYGLDLKQPEFKLDPNAAKGFISFFQKLPAERNVMRFFDRREYYTVHGDNAILVASVYYKTLTAVKTLTAGADTLSGVTVNRSMFGTLVRDLLLERADHSVEVYEGAGAAWKLVRTASPGNLGSFEEVLFGAHDMQETPSLLALKFALKDGTREIGAAWADMAQRSLGALDFSDDDQFTHLESLLVALGVKEAVLPQGDVAGASGEFRRLRDVLARCNVLVTERKKASFNPRDVATDLGRLLRGGIGAYRSSVGVDGTVAADQQLSTAAMGALLAYTDVLADDTAHGKFVMRPFVMDTFMRLDAAALRAMNVFGSKTDGNKSFSIVGIMDRTATAGMGRRLLHRWVKQPLLHVDQINERLDIVETFCSETELREDLRRSHLKRMPDIERVTRKVEGGKASLQDIVKLYQASARLPMIRDKLAAVEGMHAELIRRKYVTVLAENTGEDHLARFDALVEAAVDLDRVGQGEYVIAPAYSPDLEQLREQLDAVEARIDRAHRKAADDLDLEAHKVLKLDKGPQGHVFRISKQQETKVRKQLSSVNYISCGTRKDGVMFSTRELQRASEEHARLTDAYASTQRELVAKVVEVAATFAEVFYSVASIVAELDVLLAFADLSVSAPTPYVRPVLTPKGEGDIVLVGSRHPCVEVQDDVTFIANDCRMVRGESWFQIITGPNMGGKSTFIRQVGMAILMAQVGCYVPCDEASISVRDCIFARVGAGDCQLKGVSTFMAEMLETATILKAATPSSLVIIDELGRGTSTYDGFGLAWAIAEHLATVIRVPTLFATHFHELTELANQHAGVVNRHVSACIDEESRRLTMLYKVEEGACDQSFGIHVAEFARFPPSVVEFAKRKAAEMEDFSSARGDAPDQGHGGNVTTAKRKRVAVPSESPAALGAARLQAFLDEFMASNLEKLPPKEVLQRVRQLKESLDKDAASNPWLREQLGVC
eukprot:jgi/Mesvir1/4344/Mv02429-RA.1